MFLLQNYKYAARLLTRYQRYWTTAWEVQRTQGVVELMRRVKRKLSSSSHRFARYDADDIPPEGWQPLIFTRHQSPTVSIIIPVYNKYAYTFRCLQSVLQHSTDTGPSYEIIVVDDHSSDETAQMLADIQGLRVLKNEQNVGFIHTCNKGAAAANGEYLVFLNNDTVVQQGWLEALLATFNTHADAGLVGARLVYPSGVLQEAGGIVWCDGSAWNYGNGDNPHKPEYSYLRQVDYCSGACLMIRHELFTELDMFDNHFAPAYYEDTDLAFRVRAAGYQVYYQPAATIVHYEGVTSGTVTGSGIKQYQIINAKKFQQRWQAVLSQHRANGLQPELEKERAVKQRVLIIDARIVLPDHDSGSVRMLNLIKILQSLSYKVTFVADDLFYRPPYTTNLQMLGVEVLYSPYVKTVEHYLNENGELFDVVILSRINIAEDYLATVRRLCKRAAIIFDTVDLAFLREQRLAELEQRPSLLKAAERRQQQELSIARQADMTWVVSASEQELLAKIAPDIKVGVVSNIHQLPVIEKVDFEQRRDILFIGNYEHTPNVDAVLWFVAEVWPLISARIPEMKFYVVGGQVPQRLQALAADNIIVTGNIPDIAPLFNKIRLSVAPLRYGAGVKGKVNTSMSYGVPVVATAIAAEGMFLDDGKNILLADDAKAFTAQVINAYTNADLWQKLSTTGIENVEQHFSFAAAKHSIQQSLIDIHRKH